MYVEWCCKRTSRTACVRVRRHGHVRLVLSCFFLLPLAPFKVTVYFVQCRLSHMHPVPATIPGARACVCVCFFVLVNVWLTCKLANQGVWSCITCALSFRFAVAVVLVATSAGGSLQCLDFGGNVYLSSAPAACKVYAASLSTLMATCTGQNSVVSCVDKTINGAAISVIQDESSDCRAATGLKSITHKYRSLEYNASVACTALGFIRDDSDWSVPPVTQCHSARS